MTHRKHRSEQHCREALSVGGEKDERQAGREGQQEDDPSVGNAGIVQYPAEVIDGNTDDCGNDQWRETELAPFFVDEKAEARNGQDLANRSNHIHHRRNRIGP